MLRSKQIYFATTLLLGTVGLALSSTAFADDVVDIVNITVPSSCSLTGTGMDSHRATINNGQYNSAIGETTLKAYCNDYEGFAIFAVGFTDDIHGKNVLTDSNLSSTNDIVTGTSTSGDTSYWAMKLSTISSPAPTYPIIIAGSSSDTLKEQGDPDFSAFSLVPSSYAKVAYRTAATDIGDNAEGSTLKTTYQAYISPTQTAGTYVGQVKYVLVHPHDDGPPPIPQTTTSGYIGYYPNASSVLDTMSDENQTISASDTSATLWASNFQRPGYGFAGWSDVYDYETNPDAHFYGPNETITFTAGQYTGSNNGLSLYAVWVKSAGSLQDSAKVTALCGENGSLTQAPIDGTANLSSISALTDERDHQTYAIAKLADGKCWMIENLRLETRDTQGQNRFNASTTNESLAQGYSKSTTYGNFVGLANPEVADFSNSTTANSVYKSDTSGDHYNPSTNTLESIGTSYFPGYRIPRYRNDNTNSDPTINPNVTVSMMIRPDDGSTYKANIYSYGNYYNWSAAMANTIYYNSPTATDADGKTSETINTSICPSGWRLPYGRTTDNGNAAGGFYYLNYKLNNDSDVRDSTASNKLRSYPNNFLYSGQTTTNSYPGSRGISGSYWLSTVYDNTSAYYAAIRTSITPNVVPGSAGASKFQGFSVRCVINN